MQLVDCTFTNNNKVDPTGQIFINLAGGSVALRNCVLANNLGAGVYKANTATLGMTNCLVYRQTNNGVRVTAGTVAMGNCTVVANQGWGITNSAGTVSVINSIAWSNIAGGMTNVTATYCDSQNAINGTGNQSADPKFGSEATNDFHLDPKSPCINAGFTEAWMYTAQDLDGNRRVISGAVDLGVYEASAASPAILMQVL